VPEPLPVIAIALRTSTLSDHLGTDLASFSIRGTAEENDMIDRESVRVEEPTRPTPKKAPPPGKPENPKPTGDGPPRTTPIDAPPADRRPQSEPHEMCEANR
jgi:hypothetical protein